MVLMAGLVVFTTPVRADGGAGFGKMVCLMQAQKDIKATADRLHADFQAVEIKSDPQFTERYYATLKSIGDWNGKAALDYVEPYEKVKGATAVALFESSEGGNTVLHGMFINEDTCHRPLVRLDYQLHQEVMKRESD